MTYLRSRGFRVVLAVKVMMDQDCPEYIICKHNVNILIDKTKDITQPVIPQTSSI